MAEIDFSPIGELYNTYRKGRQNAVREQTLGQLGQGGGPIDYGTAARALLAAGDTEGGLSLARLAEAASRDQRDFGFRQQEAQRSQGNADRSFGLQKQSAEEAARGFDYREIDDGQGGKAFVKVNKATGAVEKVPIAGQPTEPNNPFAQGKMNEAQSKDALYTSRMLNSEKILRSIDNDVSTSRVQRALGTVGSKIGYNITDPQFQRFDQAKRDFINATLRRESGAVISDAEFANAEQQYFPQPGNDAELILQKRANRMEAIKGIGAGAGQGYKPAMTFDGKGELIPNPGAQAQRPSAAPAPQPRVQVAPNQAAIKAFRDNPRAVIEEARAAVKNGADPKAVAERIGINPAFLTGGS